jgi:hypothetical protein
MPKPNEATDTNLKVIERLHQIGWKQGDTFTPPKLVDNLMIQKVYE